MKLLFVLLPFLVINLNVKGQFNSIIKSPNIQTSIMSQDELFDIVLSGCKDKNILDKLNPIFSKSMFEMDSIIPQYWNAQLGWVETFVNGIGGN